VGKGGVTLGGGRDEEEQGHGIAAAAVEAPKKSIQPIQHPRCTHSVPGAAASRRTGRSLLFSAGRICRRGGRMRGSKHTQQCGGGSVIAVPALPLSLEAHATRNGQGPLPHALMERHVQVISNALALLLRTRGRRGGMGGGSSRCF